MWAQSHMVKIWDDKLLCLWYEQVALKETFVLFPKEWTKSDPVEKRRWSLQVNGMRQICHHQVVKTTWALDQESKVKWKPLSRVWLSATQWTVACQAPLSMEFSKQEYWSGKLFPSPGIFPTQRSNSGLPHCGWILYLLNNQGSPRKLEWVAFLFCRGSYWPRDWTSVSCIAGRFFTSWATKCILNK